MAKNTPWAVFCRRDGRVFLGYQDYAKQLERFDDRWSCPSCGGHATWDDDNTERNDEGLPPLDPETGYTYEDPEGCVYEFDARTADWYMVEPQDINDPRDIR
jgi:hypothetical protein